MVLLPATIKGDPCQLKYEPMQLLKPIPWHYASHLIALVPMQGWPSSVLSSIWFYASGAWD